LENETVTVNGIIREEVAARRALLEEKFFLHERRPQWNRKLPDGGEKAMKKPGRREIKGNPSAGKGNPKRRLSRQLIGISKNYGRGIQERILVGSSAEVFGV
jgi:hypothetical protein